MKRFDSNRDAAQKPAYPVPTRGTAYQNDVAGTPPRPG